MTRLRQRVWKVTQIAVALSVVIWAAWLVVRGTVPPQDSAGVAALDAPEEAVPQIDVPDVKTPDPDMPDEDVAPAVDPRAFDIPRPVIERVGPAPQSGEVVETYRTYIAQADYHAAIALGPKGEFGAVRNQVSMEDAETFALAFCNDWDPGCRIILRISPERPIEIDGLPLSRGAARLALKYLELNDGAKALALAGFGGGVATYKRKTPAEAEAEVLKACRRQEWMRAPGHWEQRPCRIIWSE